MPTIGPVETQSGTYAAAAAAAASGSPDAAPQIGAVARACGFAASVATTLLGIVSLIILLAFVAAIPVVNFIALGYLLEVEGRVARSGRLRDAFPLVDVAPRLGAIVLGVAAWIFPIRLLADAAADARLIDPGSTSELGWHLAARLAAALVAVHLCLALARGGSLACFLRPVRNARWLAARWRDGSYWRRAEAAIGEFIAALRLKHHFWLGMRGYIGALAWLAVPTALFATANKTEGGPILITLAGGVLLMLVVGWLPFLQARFAAENRFGAMFEWRSIRELYRHAPLSWLITLLVTLTLALPLYLFKIVLPPADAMWLVTVVFIASIYPAKVLTGWAYHRARVRERSASIWWRGLSRLALLPLLATFVFILFFTQFIGEHGKWVLFEHHAFLLPAPF